MSLQKIFARAVSALALLSTTVFTSAHAEDYVARVYTNSAGATLPYRLLEPQKYDSTARYPLVLFLHGAGERGSNNIAQLKHGAHQFTSASARENFQCFVIAPQCPENQQWVNMRWDSESGTRLPEPSQPMQLALGALDSIIKEFSIDTNRIYVTGLSMGGYGTWDCLTRFPNRFAAGAPICGGGDEKTVTPEVAKVPVWAFHSADDPVVKVSRTRNMIAAMRQTGGHPLYYEYNGYGHNSWDAAYAEAEFLPWLFSQRLGKQDSYTPAIAQFPADSAFPGNGPIRKMDWFRNLWTDRRTGWWKTREQDKGALVFLGDSITQGWGSLAQDFPQYKVANRGISGDVTRGVLCRLKGDVFDVKPTGIVLLIGTNDLEENGEPEVITQNIRSILAACKAYSTNMPVVVCKVMPSHESKKRPADKIQKLNQLVDELVKSDPQFVRCDSWSIFADDKGNAKLEEFPDLLHPNAAGYAKFTAALKPILDGLNLPEK